MRFKHDKLKSEFWMLHPKLRLILLDADIFCTALGEELNATCFVRTEEEQKQLFSNGQAVSPFSVHSSVPCRGADCSSLKVAGLNQKVLDYINNKYIYDIKRPQLKTVLHHGGTALHLHFQCSTGSGMVVANG